MGLKKRVFVALAGVAIASVMIVEIAHYAKYGHLLSYGWHVDVISEPANFGIPGVTQIQTAQLRNVTLRPVSVQLCVYTSDVAPYEIPAALFRLEKQDPASRRWEAVSPYRGLQCGDERRVQRTIWPLMSFSTIRGAFAGVNGFRKGDRIRFVVFSSIDAAFGARAEFVSLPYTLMEEAQPRQ